MRLFVISDIRLYRDGLCQILGQRDEFEISGVAARVDEAVGEVPALTPPPDVALLDVSQPDGLCGVRRLAATVPGLKILAITVPDQPGDVIACAESGAAGIVTRDASVQQLVEALEGVAQGEVRCSPRITAVLLEHVGSLAQGREPATLLTSRERQILKLVEAGLSNKQIAQRLSIELPTVKNHVHRIIEKLGVSNRTQAATRMRQELAREHLVLVPAD